MYHLLISQVSSIGTTWDQAVIDDDGDATWITDDLTTARGVAARMARAHQRPVKVMKDGEVEHIVPADALELWFDSISASLEAFANTRDTHAHTTLAELRAAVMG